MDTRFAVLQHLAEQTADNANQMTATVNALQQKIAAQSDATSGKLDTASGQVQSLNDSVDELKSRIAKLDKSIQDMQAQLQNDSVAARSADASGGRGPWRDSSGWNNARHGGSRLTECRAERKYGLWPASSQSGSAVGRDFSGGDSRF